jgi:MSHA biogenesis protein MshQ
MKKIFSILAIFLLLPNLAFADPKGAVCGVQGDGDFTVVFDAIGSRQYQSVYLKQGSHGYTLWYTGTKLSDSNYIFKESKLVSGSRYNIMITHESSKNTLKYYRKFSGEEYYSLMETQKLDLHPGQHWVIGTETDNIGCSNTVIVPPKPPEVGDVCEAFNSTIQTWYGDDNSGNGRLYISNSAQIIGATTNPVSGKRIVGFDESNVFGDLTGPAPNYESRINEGCGGERCWGDSSLKVPKQVLIPFPASSNTGNTWVGDQQEWSGGGQIQGVLGVGNGGVLTLKTGVYWVDRIEVNASGRIVVPRGEKVILNVKELNSGGFLGMDIADVENNSEYDGYLRVNVYDLPVTNTGTKVAFNGSAVFIGLLYSEASDSLDDHGNPVDAVQFTNDAKVYGAVTASSVQLNSSAQIISSSSCFAPPPVQQCTLLPEENFNSGSLSNWSVMGFGNSTEPYVSNGRFILNSNEQYQATASAYNYVFPSDQNYLEIEFDHYAYGGNGADGVALVISDASVPPKTGAFGGPLGYGMKLKNYPNSDVSEDTEGFAGGWIGVGIDEYGNFRREGGEQVTRGSIADNVVVRGPGATDNNGKWLKGYPFITEKKYNGSLDNRSDQLHRYKVVLNSRNGNTMTLAVFRKIGENGDWDRVIDEFDVLKNDGFNYTPENFRLSVTASTGYDKNTHAADNFQVCADKYQKITNGIHHFEFDYAGTGSICQASDVTLRACMNESCSDTYPSSITGGTLGSSLDPVTVSLLPVSSSAVAWEDGDTVTFSDSVALKLRANQSGSAKLGIASSSVTQFGFSGARCRIAGGNLSEDNCEITFNSAALGVNTPDKIAGRPFLDSQSKLNSDYSTLPYLDFCGANSTKQASDTGETRNITLSMEHVDPINPVVDVPVYVAFKQQSGAFSDEIAINSGATVTVDNVYFDNDGKASFNLRYPEAGKVKLRAQLQGEDDSKGENNFVSFPAYLEVTAMKNGNTGVCSAGVCSSGFVAASETFVMTVTAYQFGGAEAQNYQQDGLTISHSVVYPASTSAVAGNLSKKTYDHDAPKNGSVSFEQSVSEVGSFEFTVTPPDAYLGSTAFTIEPAVAVIGRLYPKYFRAYDGVDNQWAYPDGQSFTYMGQGFGAEAFYVEALNAQKGSVSNYKWFDESLQAEFNLIDTSSYATRFYSFKSYGGEWQNNLLTGVDSQSIGLFTGSASDGLLMTKDTATYAPDGPFNLNESGSNTDISIDDVSVNADPVEIDGNDGRLAVQPDIRFGRVNLDDVGGRQGDTLHIPLRVEYWNGSRFIANPNDSQTDVNGVKAAQQHIWPTDNSAKDVTLGDGGAVSSGSSRSITAKQAESYRQQTRVWLDLEANDLPWLKYNWDKDLAGEENPSSVVTFGIHRGNDRVIYRGEPGLTAQ